MTKTLQTQQQFLNTSQQTSKNLDNFYNQAINKINNENHPNYVQTEQVLISLQQENELLRQQNDQLHEQIVNGQNDENQSLIRLKLSLHNLLNDLRSRIQTFHDVETQKDQSYYILEQKLIELNTLHSNKEMEDSELIQSLTDELQNTKFELRKQESFNQHSKEKVLVLKSKVLELQSENDKLKQGIAQFSDDNCQIEIIRDSIDYLLKDNTESLRSEYERKFSKAKKNHFELKEKHDELLIKHCRLINRLKSLESDQLITWQARQQAYVDQIKHQREQITQLQNTKAHDDNYKQLQFSIAESMTIEQELLQKYQTESEVEYQRQLQVLDKQIENLIQQKASLIQIVKDYEVKYRDATEERKQQVQSMIDLNSQLKSYLESIESGSIQDVLLKYDQIVKYIQESCKTQLSAIVDKIILERQQINEDLHIIKGDVSKQNEALVEYLNNEISQLKQTDALNQSKLTELQQIITQLQQVNSQQKLEYFKMREIFERHQIRQQNINDLESSQSQLTDQINQIINDLECAKKPCETNKAMRNLKHLVLQERTDTDIVRKYSQFIQNEYQNYLDQQVYTLQQQKQKLLFNMQHQQDIPVVQSFLKDLTSLEKQRNQSLETQVDILMKIITSDSRDKYRELTENLKVYVKQKHIDHSMLIAATSGVQTLNQTMSLKSLYPSNQDSQNQDIQQCGPLVFLQSPIKQSKNNQQAQNLNNTTCLNSTIISSTTMKQPLTNSMLLNNSNSMANIQNNQTNQKHQVYQQQLKSSSSKKDLKTNKKTPSKNGNVLLKSAHKNNTNKQQSYSQFQTFSVKKIKK